MNGLSSIIFAVYRGLTSGCQPLIRAYLKRRVRQGKEDANRYVEKMAVPSQVRPPDTDLVWVHAVSVGESMSALPLIDGLVDRGYAVLVTTATHTAAEMLQPRLPAAAVHQYAPLDCVQWVRAFLCYWQPSTVIFLESELWYNTLNQIHKRGIPLYLVNARLSQKSIKTWQKYSCIARPMLQLFTKIYPQNSTTLRAITHIVGSDTVAFFGNLKYASPPPPVCNQDLQHLQSQIGARPVWVAASTHPEDEYVVEQALSHIYTHYPNILTIVVPRHPQRLSSVQHTFKHYTQAVRSKGDNIEGDTQIYIADTMGELPLFYHLAPLCLVGGSFGGGYGGHNPLEPAHYDTAVIQGYDTGNFADISDDLNAVNGHWQVQDADGLSHAVCHMLDTPQDRQKMAQNAKNFVRQHHTTVQKLLDSMGV